MSISPIVYRAYVSAPVYTGQQRKFQQQQAPRGLSSEKSLGKQIRISQLEAKISNLTSQLKIIDALTPQDIAKIEKIEAEIDEAKAELEEVKHLDFMA